MDFWEEQEANARRRARGRAIVIVAVVVLGGLGGIQWMVSSLSKPSDRRPVSDVYVPPTEDTVSDPVLPAEDAEPVPAGPQYDAAWLDDQLMTNASNSFGGT